MSLSSKNASDVGCVAACTCMRLYTLDTTMEVIVTFICGLVSISTINIFLYKNACMH